MIFDNNAFLQVDPEEHEHEREEKSCDPVNEKLWIFKFKTDRYGYETSWMLEVQDEDNEWVALSSGPAVDKKYEDNTVYMGAACLPGDKMYKLIIMDKYGDGFCCNFGDGYYSYTVDGIVEYDSRTSGEDPFKDKREHFFYVGLPVPEEDEDNGADANGPFSGRGPAGGTSLCKDNESEIRVKFWADKYSTVDNAWEIRNMKNNRVVLQRELGYYDFFTDGSNTDDIAVCVNDGEYEFTLTDRVGDGICCGRQGDGRYEIYINGELMIYGSDFNYGKRITHTIIAGYADRYENEMSQRAAQYLDCHNWRRKKYHEEWFDSTYVPLKYDFSLEEHAQNWANKLLDDCEVNGIKHEPGVVQGENLAKNRGSGKWGQLYPVENICRRWFEREETWPYPDNAHFTQGLWRSARYVGCAESEKTMDNGGTCRIQVCRYARAGNCNMGRYDAKEGDNWKIPMLMDHNPCGPVCPPGGCH